MKPSHLYASAPRSPARPDHLEGTKGTAPVPGPAFQVADPSATGSAIGKRRASFWRILGGGSFSISLAIHAILLAVGVVWVLQVFPPEERKVDFLPKSGGGQASEVRVKRLVTLSSMNPPRVAARDFASQVTLPEPDSSSPMSSMGALGSGAMAAVTAGGLGGKGSGGGRGDGKGTGIGAGIGPGLGGNGIGANPFGMLNPMAKGLVGRFYDFKRDKDGKPTEVKALDTVTYKEIIQQFARGRSWKEPRIDHYTSPTKLNTKTAFFPAVADTAAGTAFDSPEAAPGMWVAHYSATVVSKEAGTWRFIGWGDNCLVVGINGDVKLDASDRNYTGETREALGSADLPGKSGAALFGGEWFTLRAGQTFTLDILIGDEGGIFAAGVLIEKKDEVYAKDTRGLPNLPILRTSDLSPAEIDVYKGQLPEAAMKGPAFEVKGGIEINDI